MNTPYGTDAQVGFFAGQSKQTYSQGTVVTRERSEWAENRETRHAEIECNEIVRRRTYRESIAYFVLGLGPELSEQRISIHEACVLR